MTNARDRERELERHRRWVLAPEHPHRERDDCGREDDVEREQQERLLLAELDGHAERRDREEHDGVDGRVADERDRSQTDRSQSDHERPQRLGLVDEDLEVVRPDEGDGERHGGGPEEREPDDDEEAAARDQHEDGAEGADERRDLREVRVLHDPGTLRRSRRSGVVAEPSLDVGDEGEDARDRLQGSARATFLRAAPSVRSLSQRRSRREYRLR